MPMKDCQRFANKLLDYCDGILSQPQKEKWDRHLKLCANCSLLLKRAHRLHQMLGNLPQKRVSPNFNAVLRAQIRREGDRRVWPFTIFGPSWGWRLPAFASAVAILFITSVVAYNQLQNRKPVSSRMIVYTPISPSQQDSVRPNRLKIDSAMTRPRVNYVMDQVELQELLKNSRRIPLSSEGMEHLRASPHDSSYGDQVRRRTPVHLVSNRQSGVRF